MKMMSTTTTNRVCILTLMVACNCLASSQADGHYHYQQVFGPPFNKSPARKQQLNETNVITNFQEYQPLQQQQLLNQSYSKSNHYDHDDLHFNQQWRQPIDSFGGDPAIASMQTYIDELKRGFTLLIKDKSLDERLANILYSVELKTVVNHDFFQFNSGDPQEDLETERLVAGGPHVDDQLCGRHLRQMLRLSQDLSQRLERKRREPNARLGLDERHLRLARVLESFGRYESGTLSGRTHVFGSYRQCLNTGLQLGDHQDDHQHSNSKQQQQLVGSRYCWARLSIDKYLNPALRFRKKGMFEPSKHMLSTGVCLPETCHSRSIKQHKKLLQQLINSQFQLPQSIYIERHLELDSLFCLVDEGDRDSSTARVSAYSRIPVAGRVLLGLLLVWLLTACYVTLNEDEISSLARGNTASLLGQSLDCLNLKKSYYEFVGAANSSKSNNTNHHHHQRRVNFDALNPVKFAGCAFVVWAHALLVRMGYSMDQLHLPSRLEQEWAGGMVIVSSSVVDTFFVITGLLVAYITLKKASRLGRPQQDQTDTSSSSSSSPSVVEDDHEKRPPTTRKASNNNNNNNNNYNQLAQFLWATYQIVKSRYLRLLPLLLLVYWFKRSVFIYLGSGPMWDFGFNRETTNGACLQESWLVPFTFVSAYLPLSRQCLMQSWSVSNDMLNTLALAPILVIMTRKPRLAISMLVAISMLSYSSLLSAIGRLEPGDAWAVSDLRAQGMGAIFARISSIYSYPHFRITAFAIGMLAGYGLFWYDQPGAGNNGSCRQWPAWFTGPATLLSIGNVLFMFFVLANGAYFKQYISPWHIIIFPYFMSFGKMLWAASNSILFLRIMTDWNESFLARMASGQFWQSLSKLNYAILLLHFDLLLYDISNPAQGNLNNLYSIFKAFTTVYTMSLVLAAGLFILFENPMDKLTKTLFMGQRLKCKPAPVHQHPLATSDINNNDHHHDQLLTLNYNTKKLD